MKTWNVRVHRDDGSIDLGQVQEDNEELARSAALSKFGLHEDDMEEMSLERIAQLAPHRILPDDDFDVGQA